MHARWLMELEYVDIFEGKPEELEALADCAPSDSAAAFVRGAVAVRQNLVMFGRQPHFQPARSMKNES